VTVSREALAHIAPRDADLDRLVRHSFQFLLEREPKESILRSFALPVIGRYLPEYEREIGIGLSRRQPHDRYAKGDVVHQHEARLAATHVDGDRGTR
jgi:hypothetical protein